MRCLAVVLSRQFSGLLADRDVIRKLGNSLPPT
jgi:hypothetical protein